MAKIIDEDKPNYITSDLEYWMTNLPNKIRAYPIIYLSIPGSHDSGTWNITRKSKLAPDAEPIIRHLNFLGPILRCIMARWARTQSIDIMGQLCLGVRYFDLRLATKLGTDQLYLVHGLYAENLDMILNEFDRFLQIHPHEIIILDCQHFYAFNQSDHEHLISLLTSTFGPKLLPYSPHMKHISLEYMTKQFRFQIIVIYRSDDVLFGPFFWPGSSFPTPWPNTVSKTRLFYYLDDCLKKRNLNNGFITQCVLTPTTGFVCKNIFSNLKNSCVLPLEKDKYRWLIQQKPGLGGLNIVICDYVSLQDGRFSREVIALNLKLSWGIGLSPKNSIQLTPIDKK